LWVDRIGLLLKSGRLGDLGLLADGWSNLVHVQDIGTAVARAIQGGVIGLAVYNLSAPDSPRWNEYFRDFSLAARMVPLRYKTGFSMYLESRVLAPPLYALNRVLGSSALAPSTTQSIPPSLLRLFRQQIRLDSARASRELGLDWTLYRDGLAESVSYFKSRYES
jgi:nucleoside-diphosphate-sugar epimerase